MPVHLPKVASYLLPDTDYSYDLALATPVIETIWEEDGISPKLRIHFDMIDSFEEEKNRSAVHESVLCAYSIKRKPSEVTEPFAASFFAKLR